MISKQIFNFSRIRKAKFFKPEFYSSIPHFMQIKKRDPFEYPLRPKNIVMEEVAKDEMDFPIRIIIKHFIDGEEEGSHIADKSRKVPILNRLN